MANELEYVDGGGSGRTLYAKPTPIVAAPWGDDAVALAETGATQYYSADVAEPADVYVVYEQAGVSPADSDAPIGVIETGSATVDATGLATDADMQTLLSRTAGGVTVNLITPAFEQSFLTTIRGDDYTAASPHGPQAVFDTPASVYGNLQGAAFKFTSRRVVDDEIELETTNGFTVLNADTEDQQVRFELTADQTKLLTPGSLTSPRNKYDIQVTRADGVVFTLSAGSPPYAGHRIVEDQSRPAS